MKQIILLAALALPACAGSPHVDVCKGAELRRTGYQTTIGVADAWAASGRIVPYQIAIAKQAAVAALVILDGNCPVT